MIIGWSPGAFSARRKSHKVSATIGLFQNSFEIINLTFEANIALSQKSTIYLTVLECLR
jgi:hypothetical protein